eukprot:GFUD01014468.1.p1 GENE.GFUD01014468.1~~GFUD01014468.1.p1  ORF type:complete len:162 (+),score=47.98 GFUD01014468.1:55-540(+)
MAVIIRPAMKEDCKGLRGLIQELADYEKMPDGPKISAETLEEDGFGPTKFFHCIVAELENKLVGFTLFYYTYSTWEGKSVYMEDLYVQPDQRGKGTGTKLWKALVDDALTTGCSRCNFSVLDWNTPSIEYYKRKGAVDLSTAEGWLCFRMNKDEMERFVQN